MPESGVKVMPYGSAEAKRGTGNERRWAVRSTLMRIKNPEKITYNMYEPGIRDHPKCSHLDPKNPPASPFDCTTDGPKSGVYGLFKECSVCTPQYFPASLGATDIQAEEHISSIVKSIKADLAFLRDALSKHADFIVSRWKKKSREKRFTLLATNTSLLDKKWAAVHLLDRVGVPDRKYFGERVIPKVRTIRSDGRYKVGVEFHTPESLADANRRDETLAKHWDSWFLPYLDAQTLSEDPSLFLSLLHHRTVNEPEKWIMFDNANVVLVEHFGIMSSIFNRQCVVMQGPDFGKLVEWNAEQAHRWEIVSPFLPTPTLDETQHSIRRIRLDDPEYLDVDLFYNIYQGAHAICEVARCNATRHPLVGFTKAHVLLTAQKTMMNLLGKCVKSLLAEADSLPILELHPNWTRMITSNFSRFEAKFAWSTDFAKPYSQPPIFNPREVAELITSRHRATIDELELLQTDPQHVQSLSKEISACLFFESWRHEDIMPWIIDYLFFETMYRESCWRQLVAESDLMIRYLDIFEKYPSPASKQEYDQAVFIVYDLCIETFACFEPQVQTGLVIQRGFERNFEFTGSAKFKSTNRTFASKDGFPDDLLYWSTSSLGYDEDRPFTMDPSFNFAIIDHLCRTDPKEADRISQTMLDRLSDLSVVSEMIACIRSDTTRNRSVLGGVAKTFKASSTSPDDWVKKINAGRGKAAGNTLGPELQQLLLRCAWPRGKKDMQWLQDANASRACLTKLWTHLKIMWREDLKKAGVSERLIEEDMKLLCATTTQRYKDELEAEKQSIRRELLSQKVASRHDDQPEIQTVWGKENEPGAAFVMRPKTKTALADPDRSDAIVPAAATVVEKLALPPVNFVKHDNLAVFHHMYPKSGAEAQRSFSWQHFLGAMVDAGFTIVQSQGSAVTLRRDSDEDDCGVNTIVLHRPHPTPTVNPVMLRRMAKRFEKWFGWHREMFVERLK
ncbi:hypothetical protein E4T39_01519 [Aureobasidium subglaciale]|nr:hypothetical protein E4T39_01519 [Aureobasidium subglaciale]